MKDKVNPQKLKNVNVVHEVIMEKLSKLTDNDDFDLDELIKIRDRLGETITQLDFWVGRDNSQRFYDELKSHISWILKNYEQYLKPSEKK